MNREMRSRLSKAKKVLAAVVKRLRDLQVECSGLANDVGVESAELNDDAWRNFSKFLSTSDDWWDTQHRLDAIKDLLEHLEEDIENVLKNDPF